MQLNRNLSMFALTCLTATVYAQSTTTTSTDGAAFLNERLKPTIVTRERVVKKRDVQCVLEACVNSNPGETSPASRTRCKRCETFFVDVPESYADSARVVNTEIESLGAIELGAPQISSLPENVVRTLQERINCSRNSKLSTTRTISHSVQTGYAVSTTKGVSATRSAQGQFQVKLGDGLTVGGSASIQAVANASTTVTDSRTETTVESETVSYEVPARTKMVARFEAEVYKITIPFSAAATLNGDLEPNVSGVHKASSVLGAAERTTRIEGQIVVMAASKSKAKIMDVPLSEADCVSAKPGAEPTISDYETVVVKPGASSLVDRKRALPAGMVLRKATDLPVPFVARQPNFGFAGQWCHTQPCNLPLDGFRKVCYRDENLYCNDCRDEPDSVCMADPSTQRGTAPKQ